MDTKFNFLFFELIVTMANHGGYFSIKVAVNSVLCTSQYFVTVNKSMHSTSL